jgi:hypothetical protein
MRIPKELKAAAGSILFGLWGAYLLYIWVLPDQVPAGFMTLTTRKALFLTREFQPGALTLTFAVLYIWFALFILVKLAKGQLRD